MTLDEQLSAIVTAHDLASVTITMHNGASGVWAHVAVQWRDEKEMHGRIQADGEHRLSVRDGLEQAISRANERRLVTPDVPELQGV